MLIAAGFTLFKLLNSDFAQRLDVEEGKFYLSQTVRAVRSTSVATNDIPVRLAEVLAQLWKASSTETKSTAMKSEQIDPAFGGRRPSQTSLDAAENPLRLKVRSRMSQSVVYDSVWRWRETQVNNASERLDSSVLNNPTNPDSSSNSTPPPGVAANNNINMQTSTQSIQPSENISVDPTTNIASIDPLITGSTAPGQSLSAPHINASGGAMNMPLGMMNGLAMSSAADSYELFDSVSWFLDAQPTLGFGNQPEWNSSAFGGFGSAGDNGFL